MIIEVFCSGPVHTNSVLIGCQKTGKAAIIDAPEGIEKVLAKRVKELGLTPELLLLTHSHWDHTAAAASLKKKWNISLYVHELDAPNVEHPGIDGLPLFIDIPSASVDHFLKEGETLSVGELKLEVLHTPGHTPGGVCFYLPEHDLLLSGDTLFQGTIGNLSFPTGEPEKMWKSLEKLSQLPSNTRVIPGHGGETTIGAEKRILWRIK